MKTLKIKIATLSLALATIGILGSGCDSLTKTQKGAAIGAVIGAGAGAGSVYVQGRNDVDLTAGTELTVRATGPRG